MLLVSCPKALPCRKRLVGYTMFVEVGEGVNVVQVKTGLPGSEKLQCESATLVS